MAKKRNRRSQKPGSQKPTGRKAPDKQVQPESGEDLSGEGPRVGKSAAPGSAGQMAIAQTRQEATAAQLEQEYGYVAKDLRRVFLLAGAMFALLIALNLLLS
jgi:hypothetical protein